MKKLTKIKIVLIVCLTGYLVLDYSKSNFKAEEFGLGEGTTSHFAFHDGFPIHINKLNQEQFGPFQDGIETKGKGKEITLFSGNSQTHGINQYESGDSNYVSLLHNKVESEYIVSHSIQNASLQYFLLSLTYLHSKTNLKKVIVPLFYDDFREDGIRQIFFENLVVEDFHLESYVGSISGDLNSELDLMKSDGKITATSENRSTQKITEEKIESFLSSNSDYWSARKSIRGKLFTQLYQLRNRVFGINAQTIRKKMPLIYNKNIDALEGIIAFCKANEIELHTYIPPIRNDVSIPYVIEDYENFKSEVELIVRNASFKHYNFENIVPAALWGVKTSTTGSNEKEYDFMHFTGEGHQLLFSELYSSIYRKSNN